MAPEPQRREVRRTHLDASVVPVERALLARAAALEAGRGGGSATVTVAWPGYGGGGGGGGGGGSATVIGQGGTAIGGSGGAGGGSSSVSVLGVAIAAEFRALAEELHWH